MFLTVTERRVGFTHWLALPEVEESQRGDTRDDNADGDHWQGMPGYLQSPPDWEIFNKISASQSRYIHIYQ